MKPAIALMAKAPLVGRVKTRLCPPLTLAQAAEVYAGCLAAAVGAATAVEGADVLLALAEEDRPWMAREYPSLPALVVDGPTIGDCLAAVFSSLLAAGRPAVVALATDAPALDAPRVAAALAALAGHDASLVAALDGGYSLLGLRRPAPSLFAGVPWSTPAVLAETRARLAAAGLSCALIGDPLRDLDDIADLDAIRGDIQTSTDPRLARLRAALARLDGPRRRA